MPAQLKANGFAAGDISLSRETLLGIIRSYRFDFGVEQRQLTELKSLFDFLERQLKQQLTPMHKIHIDKTL